MKSKAYRRYRDGLIGIGLATVLLMGLMGGCAQRTDSVDIDRASIATQIAQRFERAYGRWLALSDIALSPRDSELNDATHRAFDVRLEAIVQADVAEALAQLPDTPENRMERRRLEGLKSLHALKKGQKIVSRLQALAERQPESGQWKVIGLIRREAEVAEP